VSLHPSTYEREFIVGPVHVVLWKTAPWGPDGPVSNDRQVTLECVHTDITGQIKSSEVINVQDIPKAIFALKQAYDYATKYGKVEAPSDINAGPLDVLPERIP